MPPRQGLQPKEKVQGGPSDTCEFAPLGRSPAGAIQDRWWIRTSVQRGTAQSGATHDLSTDQGHDWSLLNSWSLLSQRYVSGYGPSVGSLRLLEGVAWTDPETDVVKP